MVCYGTLTMVHFTSKNIIDIIDNITHHITLSYTAKTKSTPKENQMKVVYGKKTFLCLIANLVFFSRDGTSVIIGLRLG